MAGIMGTGMLPTEGEVELDVSVSGPSSSLPDTDQN
jgi:hypothetical protein